MRSAKNPRWLRPTVSGITVSGIKEKLSCLCSQTRGPNALSLLTRDAMAGNLLRWSLAIVYLWFGALKLIGMSPAVQLVRQSFPILARPPLYTALALFEIGLGVALLFGMHRRMVAAAVLAHLLGTFGVLVVTPRASFLPVFPYLTMDGEFVVKNVVLFAAACGLWILSAGTHCAPPLHHSARFLLPVTLSAALLGAVGARVRTLSAAPPEQTLSPIARQVWMSAAGINSLMKERGTPPIELRGDVTSRCLLMGCWIVLRDRTGQTLVDLAPEGLNGRTIPVGSRVQVSGHIGETRLSTVGFVAERVRRLDGSLDSPPNWKL